MPKGNPAGYKTPKKKKKASKPNFDKQMNKVKNIMTRRY